MKVVTNSNDATENYHQALQLPIFAAFSFLFWFYNCFDETLVFNNPGMRSGWINPLCDHCPALHSRKIILRRK